MIDLEQICISYQFVIIHKGVDHCTWTSHVQFTHEYSQATQVCTHAYACPESAHVCDIDDTSVGLNLWVTCTICRTVQ